MSKWYAWSQDLQEYIGPKSKRQIAYSKKIQIQPLSNQDIKTTTFVVVQESTQLMEGEELKGLKKINK